MGFYMWKKSLFLLAVLVMAGCASVPQEIAVPDEQQLISYQRAVTSGEASIDQPARWGGVVVNTENKPEQTIIEVVYFPLKSNGRPDTSEQTLGRFKAVIDGFVDPIVFDEGRSITFVGKVGGVVSGLIGEQPYIYPTIQADTYYLWRKQANYDVSTVFFNFRTGWYSPFYYPFHSPFWGMGHSRIRVIEKGNFNHQSSRALPASLPKASRATNNSGAVSSPSVQRVTEGMRRSVQSQK